MNSTTTDSRQVVDRLAKSAVFRDLVAADRAETCAKRNAIYSAYLDALPKLEAAWQHAEKVNDEAIAAALAAKKKFNALCVRNAETAYAAYNAKQAIESLREHRAERPMRALADPRIADLNRHIRALVEWCRGLYGLTNAVVVHQGTMAAPLPRFIPGNNAAELEVARESLNQLLVELEALEIAPYGAELTAKLQAVLDRANEVCRPLLVYASQRPQPHHEIEA